MRLVAAAMYCTASPRGAQTPLTCPPVPVPRERFVPSRLCRRPIYPSPIYPQTRCLTSTPAALDRFQSQSCQQWSRLALSARSLPLVPFVILLAASQVCERKLHRLRPLPGTAGRGGCTQSGKTRRAFLLAYI